MNNKILLIRPLNIYNYNNYPPLNLISLGSELKVAGYDVRIINCSFEKDPLKLILENLKEALFVGITMITSEVLDGYNIAKFIKENSNIPVVVGGPHCTLFPEQMAKSEYVDYVIAGEGEKYIVDIANILKNKQKPTKKVFEKQELDLNELSIIDYSIDKNIECFINGYLTDKLSECVKQPMRWLPYESSRGCPSQCTFCINVVTGNTNYRKKSAEKVIYEIEYIVKKYKISHLKIIDDNFFVDIKRVRQICEALVEKKLNISWDAECRCDYFNDKMLNDVTLGLLKSAGLVQLTLGVESGSKRTLKLMKKEITPEQAEYAVKKCNQYGIIARSSFILEIPGERLEDIKQTIFFINRLRKYKTFTCGSGTFRPYPKCELTKKLLDQGYLTEPNNFSEWADKDIVNMYTSAEYIRPWQINGKYSESAAYYLNMESAVRLGNYQLDNVFDRLRNRLFMFLAKIRNRLFFYNFPIDKHLYKKFLVGFYQKRQNLEKAGAYPITKLEE